MNTNIKIRFGTFETNSSSAHTVVLRDNHEWTTNEEIQEYLDARTEKATEGYIETAMFKGDADYGRGFDMLYEWHEKMSYLIAIFSSDDEKLDEIVEVIKERIPGIKGIAFKNSYYNYDRENTAEFIPYPYPNYDIDDIFGSVDHQSLNNIDNCISAIRKDDGFRDMTDKEIINWIIFNNKFIIVVDGDESYLFGDYLDNNYFEEAGFTHVLDEQYHWDGKESTTNPIFVDINKYKEQRYHEE